MSFCKLQRNTNTIKEKMKKNHIKQNNEEKKQEQIRK